MGSIIQTVRWAMGDGVGMVLGRKLTIEEAEADHPGVEDERALRSPELGRPFGFQNPHWEAMKAAMRPGDEIWTFGTSADAWRNLAGRQGVALVREGQVVLHIVTLMN